MSVQISLEQECTVVDQVGSPSTYRVANNIVASEGVELALFVYKTSPDEYSHIATVYDINAYPNSLSQAISDGLDFYRRPDVTRDFDSIDVALDFATVVRSRLQALANDLPVAEANFAGKATFTFVTGG